MLRCNNILCVKGPTTVFVPQGPQMFVCFKNPFQTHQWTGYTHTHTHTDRSVCFSLPYMTMEAEKGVRKMLPQM